MSDLICVFDVGTTGARTIVFNINGNRHACRWWHDDITATDVEFETVPRKNSLAVWGPGQNSCCRTAECGNNTGHVAYVEEVTEEGVYINEANVETYDGTQEGGGYDGYTKLFTAQAMAERNIAG